MLRTLALATALTAGPAMALADTTVPIDVQEHLKALCMRSHGRSLAATADCLERELDGWKRLQHYGKAGERLRATQAEEREALNEEIRELGRQLKAACDRGEAVGPC